MAAQISRVASSNDFIHYRKGAVGMGLIITILVIVLLVAVILYFVRQNLTPACQSPGPETLPSTRRICGSG